MEMQEKGGIIGMAGPLEENISVGWVFDSTCQIRAKNFLCLSLWVCTEEGKHLKMKTLGVCQGSSVHRG